MATLPPESAPLPFGPATAAWFSDAFRGATPIQAAGWPVIASGRHSLLLAPTGSGKTLAAFLWSLDRCFSEPAPGPGVRVLYVSPLKALAYDVDRNLRAPLAGIRQAAERLRCPVTVPRCAVRTGDTPGRERQAFLRDPAEILVTTPESLFLMLGSRARSALRTVQWIIVDEVHALVSGKRGVHLALSLERLVTETQTDPQRIGLSATARPKELVARYLGGDREVTIVDTTEPPQMDLRVVVPELPAESEAGALASASGPILAAVAREAADTRQKGAWPAILGRILEEIHQHRTTLVFVNSRGLCERLAQRLNDLNAGMVNPDAADDGGDAPVQDGEDGETFPDDPWADDALPPFLKPAPGTPSPQRASGSWSDSEADTVPDLVRAHHGSLSHGKRKETEELLKLGQIRGIVATSSLELGIDMAAVDRVVMVGSPGAVSSGLQRIGRAGHQVGEVSAGVILPKHPGEVAESAVIAERMLKGEVESLRMPRRCLDVLAQQIVAHVAVEERSVASLWTWVRRAAPYADLEPPLLHGVLDMLSGRYPTHDFADLRAWLTWDRTTDQLAPRAGATLVTSLNGGTIPDRGLYPVHHGPEGPRVGELDEEMVHETRVGHVIALGATSWRVLEIGRDRVVVEPAPGEPARLPFWKGDGPGRPLELGRALGAFLRSVAERSPADARDWLAQRAELDSSSIDILLQHVGDQVDAGALPTDRQVVVERFRDELGDWKVCILTPFGSRVHAPWALALEQRFLERTGLPILAHWSDDGIILRLADTEPRADDAAAGSPAPVSLDDPFRDLAQHLVPDPADLEDLVVAGLGASSLFAAHFRENASRALLIPRRSATARRPLWLQRLKSRNLLLAAQEHPSFPIILETYRTCLQDVFDVPALGDVLRDVQGGKVAVVEVETESPSPFARSLATAFTAAWLYETDAPPAERRAQALTLDRDLLAQLLSVDELRRLLDSESVQAVEEERQRLAEGRRARHADGLHDLLRELGDLSTEEVAARCEADPESWLIALHRSGRALAVRVAGHDRWIAVEDAGLFRDGLGVVLPGGVPSAFLDPVSDPISVLVRRFARTHGPFTVVQVCQRLGLADTVVRPVLEGLLAKGVLTRGGFLPDGVGEEWCDPDALRSIRLRALAQARRRVAPVSADAFTRHVLQWHRITDPASGPSGLLEVLERLEGVPLHLSQLETLTLPARVRDYDRRWLADIFRSGAWVWIGDGAIGAKNGRVRLFRRQRVPYLATPPVVPTDLDPVSAQLLEVLNQRGACFRDDLGRAVGIVRSSELHRRLWGLAVNGLITNDTLAGLYSQRSQSRGVARRMPGRNAWELGEGRWSSVQSLFSFQPPETERLHAAALQLLERHGIVARGLVGSEAWVGRFAGVYGVLRQMEEHGHVRRGLFVDGLAGAQFALPLAVERLRDTTGAGVGPVVRVVGATDPAQLYGASLPWPDTDPRARVVLRRESAALVVFVDGTLTMYLNRARKLVVFGELSDDLWRLTARALREVIPRVGGSSSLEAVNGECVLKHPKLELLRQTGFDISPFVVGR